MLIIDVIIDHQGWLVIYLCVQQSIVFFFHKHIVPNGLVFSLGSGESTLQLKSGSQVTFWEIPNFGFPESRAHIAMVLGKYGINGYLFWG